MLKQTSLIINVKTKSFIFVILASCITKSYAQNIVPHTLIRANHTTYKTDTLKYGHTVLVENEKNIYRNKKSNNSRAVIEVEKGNSSILNSFKAVFKAEKLKQLTGEPVILITFYITNTGKILEVSFILKQNTLVTAAEIEKLEDEIKNNVTFKTNKENEKTDGFYIINQVVRFDKVLDGTLPD